MNARAYSLAAFAGRVALLSGAIYNLAGVWTADRPSILIGRALIGVFLVAIFVARLPVRVVSSDVDQMLQNSPRSKPAFLPRGR